MKTIIFLTVLLLSIVSCSAQLTLKDKVWDKDTSRHAPNKSVLIKVYPTTFMLACNAILDSDMEIEKKDNDLQTAATRTKAYSDILLIKRMEPVVHLRMKGDTAVFKSQVYMGDMFGWVDGEYNERKNGKPIKNTYVQGFLSAYMVAQKLGGNIRYAPGTN